MSLYRAGYWTLIAYFLIDFGQVHRMIPGFEHLKLGAITQVTLITLVACEAFKWRWARPIALWRLREPPG
jgi:hypothetical protein